MKEICISCGIIGSIEDIKKRGFLNGCCPERDVVDPVEMRKYIKKLEGAINEHRAGFGKHALEGDYKELDYDVKLWTSVKGVK